MGVQEGTILQTLSSDLKTLDSVQSTMVSHFGIIFFPVASGNVAASKNNTRVLGRGGQAGARQKMNPDDPDVPRRNILRLRRES